MLGESCSRSAAPETERKVLIKSLLKKKGGGEEERKANKKIWHLLNQSDNFSAVFTWGSKNKLPETDYTHMALSSQQGCPPVWKPNTGKHMAVATLNPLGPALLPSLPK